MHITTSSVLIYHLTEFENKVKLNTYLRTNFYHSKGSLEKRK